MLLISLHVGFGSIMAIAALRAAIADQARNKFNLTLSDVPKYALGQHTETHAPHMYINIAIA